ncbi:MAG: lysophospholipase [Sphaerochaetaceae bacterium]|nr:lysophospholipase [Sphaerochaetaceae bacterium]
MTVILCVFSAVFLLGIIPMLVMALHVFRMVLVRTSPDKWSRKCSCPEDEQQLGMYREGLKWRENHKDRISEVSVESDGFRLAGEYFDSGSDKAVIIISGRTEGCLYSWYFAAPYEQLGCNILVIDIRSHGLSEGKYNTLGLNEYRDVLKWGEMLHNKGNLKVICHGICIGSASALYALTDAACPSYMSGMVAEGMYSDFKSLFRQHLIQEKRNYPFFIDFFFFVVAVKYGKRAGSYGPSRCINKMTKPILFLHSREDEFSVPEKTAGLFGNCPSVQKRFVWFDKGRHSFIRYVSPSEYDSAVITFWKQCNL